MLKSLFIKNFALIEEIEIDFSSGLNILTGETGAGKSILIDAFMTALGERASSNYVKTGEKKAIVEASFDISALENVKNFLSEKEIECENEIILRRELSASGSSRCFINDSPNQLSVMKELGDLLVDFHGQYDHQLLLNSNYHIDILDSICDFEQDINKYLSLFNSLKENIAKLKALETESRESIIKMDNYTFEINELKKINPLPNEENDLEVKLKKIENSEFIASLSGEIYHNLYEKFPSLRDELINTRKNIEKLSEIIPEYEIYIQECNSAIITIEEIAKFSLNINESANYDPIETEALKERMYALSGLRKKYGSIEEALARKEFLNSEINKYSNFDEIILRLKKEINSQRIELGTFAEKLSGIRKEKAILFEDFIIEKLKYLGMENAKFKVVFSQIAEDDLLSAVVEKRSFRAFKNGIDKAEFYVAINAGDSLKPLKDTASGGEISRIMLSVKSIAAKYKAMPMLVFDEIDSGISGKIAQKTGVIMKQLSENHQILAITHLPQIAALGNRHFFVSKTIINNKTNTSIRILDDTEKVNAVAQMISGESVTEAALKSAEELIAYNYNRN